MEKTESGTAFVNGSGKVHFGNKRDYSTKVINYEFNKFYYNEIIKLLLNVYEEKIVISEIRVNSLFAQSLFGISNLRSAEGKDGLLESIPENVMCEFEYQDVLYLLDMRVELDKMRIMHYYLNFTYPKNQQPCEKMGHELLRLAFLYTSSFKKGCCEISLPPGEREAISYLDVNFINPPPSNIEEVYVKDEIKNDIERFVYTLRISKSITLR